MSNLNLKTAELPELRKTPPNELLPYLPRWIHNNSRNDLGICRFMFDLMWMNQKMGFMPLLKDFKMEYGVAPWAKDGLAMYYTYEEGMTIEDRTYAITTYRNGSKTFWFSFSSPFYEGTVGQYGIFHKGVMLPEVDYQILRAKTGKEGKKRLMNISSFLNNQIVKMLFGDLKPTFKQVKDKEGKDTGDLLILANKYIYETSGIDQPSRGMNIFQIRPKKILFDDVQNRENTKTPDRREQCDREVMEESFPAVDDNGVMVYICNRTHEDDTGGKLMHADNKQWKKQFHTLTVKIINGKKYPGVGDLENEVPEWPRRWDIERIKKMRDWWVTQPKLGGMRGWLKEKYNIIKSEAEYELKYHDAKYLRAFGQNWLVFNDTDYINVDIVIGCDPAISEKKDTSDAVISALAFAPDKKRYVLEQSSGKYDINDRFIDPLYNPRNGVVALDDEVAEIRRKGSVGEMIRMLIKYSAYGVSVETAGQQGTFFNDLCDKLTRLGLAPVKFPYTGGYEKKTEKNKECPLAYFELGMYYLRPDMAKLKAEVDAFPFAKQDHIDSLRIAEQIRRFPALIKFNPLGLKQPTDYTPIEPAIIYGSGDGNRTHNLEDWVCTP